MTCGHLTIENLGIVKMSNLIFVYGTLKKGGALHSHLSGATHIGDYVTPAEYTMYDLWHYPGVTHKGTTAIHGEVYEVDNFDYLDVVEGYPNLFTREEIKTPYGDAQIYLYNVNPEHEFFYSFIPSGVWDNA